MTIQPDQQPDDEGQTSPATGSDDELDTEGHSAGTFEYASFVARERAREASEFTKRQALARQSDATRPRGILARLKRR